MMQSSSFLHTDVTSWWLEPDDDTQNPFDGEENQRDCLVFAIDCNEDMVYDDSAFQRQLSVYGYIRKHHIKSIPNDIMALCLIFYGIDDLFANCCKAIANSLKRKIRKSNDDLVCFILYNVLEQRNPMHLNHIYLLSAPHVPSAKLIHQIQNLPTTYSSQFASLSNNKQCDFRDLLWTIQNIFCELDVIGTKYDSKRVFIFTANDNPMHKDLNATIAKAQDMLDAGTEIQVFPMSRGFNIKRFYGNICTLNLDELPTANRLKQHWYPTLKVLEHELRLKEMKKRAAISCPLTIGPNFKIAVKIYSLYHREKKGYPKWLDARTNHPLTTETRFICTDTGHILEESNIRTYFGSYRQKAYFTKAEVQELKSFGNPSLALIGFKSMDRLKPYFQYKPSQFIYPDEERCSGSTLAFNSLMIAMSELNQFAICRYKSQKVRTPRFVALIPQIEKLDDKGNQIQPSGMNMIYLPYADDIRKIFFAVSHRCNKPENQILVDKAKNIIDKLLIDKVIEPSNPVLQQHYNALQTFSLEQMNIYDDHKDDDEIVDEMKPDHDRMLDVANKEIDEYLNILDQFGDHSLISTPTQKKRSGWVPKPKQKIIFQREKSIHFHAIHGLGKIQSLVFGYSRRYNAKALPNDILSLCLLFYGIYDFEWKINKYEMARFKVLDGPTCTYGDITFQIYIEYFAIDDKWCIGFKITDKKSFCLQEIVFSSILYCKETNMEIRNSFCENSSTKTILIPNGWISGADFKQYDSFNICSNINVINLKVFDEINKKIRIYHTKQNITMKQRVKYEWKLNKYMLPSYKQRKDILYYSPSFDNGNWCLIFVEKKETQQFGIQLQSLIMPAHISAVCASYKCQLVYNTNLTRTVEASHYFTIDNNIKEIYVWWNKRVFGKLYEISWDRVSFRVSMEILEAKNRGYYNPSHSSHQYTISRPNLKLFGIIDVNDSAEKISDDDNNDNDGLILFQEFDDDSMDYTNLDHASNYKIEQLEEKIRSDRIEFNYMLTSLQNNFNQQLLSLQNNFNAKIDSISKQLLLDSSTMNENIDIDKESVKKVKLWLSSVVQLPQYFDTFISNGFDSLYMMKEINDKQDLEYIGINKKAHQIKIMNHIKKI